MLTTIVNKILSPNRDLVVAIRDVMVSSHLLAELSVDGTLLDANQTFLDTFGYRRDELIGQRHSLLLSLQDRDGESYKAFWGRLRAGQSQTAEFRRVRKDGGDVWVHGSYVPVRDWRGRVCKIVKFASDITQDVTRNIDSAGKIQALGRSHAVIDFLPDGTVLDANSQFLATFGYALEEIAGKHHGMFVDAAVRQSREYRDFWQGLGEGRHQVGEFERVASGGRRLHIQASYNPVFDGGGRLVKIVKLATDITAAVEDRERRLTMLRDMQSILDDITRAVGEVSSEAENANGVADKVAEDVGNLLTGAEDLIGTIDSVGRLSTEAAIASQHAMTEASNTDTVVANLKLKTERIAAALEAIKALATQTDLLALNATIEAANAGEAGRGFSIVAQEVKALARQTTHAAAQIFDELKNLSEASVFAGKAIETIKRDVDKLHATADSVACAVEKQKCAVNDMSSKMRTVAISRSDIMSSVEAIISAANAACRSTRSIHAAAEKQKVRLASTVNYANFYNRR